MCKTKQAKQKLSKLNGEVLMQEKALRVDLVTLNNSKAEMDSCKKEKKSLEGALKMQRAKLAKCAKDVTELKKMVTEQRRIVKKAKQERNEMKKKC